MSKDTTVTLPNDITDPMHWESYRWSIMILGALTNAFVVAVPSMGLSVLFPEITKDLKLSLFQSGLVWGISSLPMIVSSLLAGRLCDRYGPKRMLILNCLLIGSAGALRGLSGNFAFLLFAVLLFGFFAPVITLSNFMNAVLWFPPRERGFANGLATLGMALGFFVGSMISATFLSPLLGGWRNVFFLYGALSVMFAIAWVFTRSTSTQPNLRRVAAGTVSFKQGMSQIASLKNIWFLGFAIMGMSGSIQGVLGYLPLYLQDLGWSVGQIGGVLSSFHIASMLSVLPLTIWSDRFGSKRTVLILAATLTAVGLGLLSAVKGGAIWGAMIIAGSMRDGFIAIFMTTVNELKDLGKAYAGLAAGFVMIFMGIGNLLAPPAGNSLATGEMAEAPLIFWASLAVLGGLCLLLAFRQEITPKEQSMTQPQEVS